MHITMTAIDATVNDGKLKATNLTAKLRLFPDGTEVIILARQDFNIMAGSDHTRHQLSEAKKELAETKAEAAQLRAKEEAVRK